MYLNSTHCMRSTNDKQLFPSGVENLKDKKKIFGSFELKFIDNLRFAKKSC